MMPVGKEITQKAPSNLGVDKTVSFYFLLHGLIVTREHIEAQRGPLSTTVFLCVIV